VQVSHSEDLANHTGPESCVGIREDAGEALTDRGVSAAPRSTLPGNWRAH
jgi:hypothetical protein